MKKIEFQEVVGGKGKKPNQKLKPYLVMRFLQKYSDKNNPKNAEEIASHIIVNYDIFAERRAIYRDIQDINKVYIMESEGMTAHEAEEYLEDCDDEEKAVVYLKNKGFYWRDRGYSEEDIFLLAECINSAKFLSKKEAESFLELISDTYLSENQRQLLKDKVFLIDRARINRNDMIRTIETINNSMRTVVNNEAHTPHKISFYYLKYTISNLNEQIKRRKGEKYIVSPYKLIINDGNYYLLGYDDKYKKIRTYRVDRMKEVTELSEPREGEEAYKQITNIKGYIQEKFNMFDGKRERVEIQFTSNLLDTFIERFGSNRVYKKLDDRHYSISTDIEVSPPFFGWLCGFGNMVKILEPKSVEEDFRKHLENILNKYE